MGTDRAVFSRPDPRRWVLELARRLNNNSWPTTSYPLQDPDHTASESSIDLPGILLLIQGLDPSPKVRQSASNTLVSLLEHLYPHWTTLRPIYWEQWQEKVINRQRAALTRTNHWRQ